MSNETHRFITDNNTCHNCGNEYVDNYCPKCIQILSYVNNIVYSHMLGNYIVSDWFPYKVENEKAFKNLSVTGFKINVNDTIKKFRLERLLVLLPLMLMQSDISKAIWVRIMEFNLC